MIQLVAGDRKILSHNTVIFTFFITYKARSLKNSRANRLSENGPFGPIMMAVPPYAGHMYVRRQHLEPMTSRLVERARYHQHRERVLDE